MQRINIAKNIWVERLGMIEITRLFLRGNFFNNMVRYNEHRVTWAGNIFLRFLKKIKFSDNFCPVSLSMGGKTPDGSALTYYFQQNLDTCLDGFCSRYIPEAEDWFKRMVKTYLASYLANRVAFITMVESELPKFENAKHEILLVRHPANPSIINFYKKKGLNLKQSFSLREHLRIIVIPLYYFIKTLFLQVIGSRIMTNIDNPKPSIWAEYEGNSIMIKATRLLFWQDYVNYKDFDLVLYLDRPDTPVSKKALSYFANSKFKWVNCRDITKFGKFNLKDIYGILLQFITFNFKRPIWFHFFRLQFLVLYKIYNSIYRSFKVKILIQHQEASWRQEVQVKALESNGGIMLGFQWSATPFFLEPVYLTPQHVYFVWGKAIYEWLQRKGDTCRHIFPCGLWITPDKEKPKELFNLSKDLKFIISIFDSSVNYNISQNVDSLSQFYSKVLQLLENNPSWGGIVKSKNWDLSGLNFLPHGDKIVSSMRRLNEEKRLVFLDRDISPLTASACSNLSLCYGLNSAGIIAGTYGYRAIHWDCSGWLHHPLYRDPKQKITFLSLDEFEQAIIKAGEGDTAIGDFAHWRELYNYFGDFNASKRVGKFIQNFMDKVIETNNATLALDFATKKYLEENRVGEDFYQMDEEEKSFKEKNGF